MKRILVILAFYVFFLGYSQNRIYFDAEWNLTTKDKMVFYRDVSKENGLFHIKDFFKSGKLQMEGNSLNDGRDGEIYEGKVIWYSENGKVIKTAEFSKGKQIGKEIEYDEKQRIISDLNYNNEGYSGKKYEFKDSPERSRLNVNSIWEYENSEVVKYIAFDEDIKGIRKEQVFNRNNSESSEFFYDEKGILIGEKRSAGGGDYTKTEVEYYYDPMKVYRITEYDKRGLQQVVKAFYPDGKIKYEEYNNEKAFKKAYDENGITIGNLTYYPNSQYNTMPLDGDDVIFDEESFALKSIDHYENGMLVKTRVFYPNGDTKIVFYNSDKITKTEYYDSNSVLKGTMMYDEEDNPVNGIRFDFYKGRETRYENRKLIYDRRTDENHILTYEKIFNPSKKIFEVKVFNKDRTLNFSYELPENPEKFTTTVTVYGKNKPLQQIKFLNGIIQNGKITLQYKDYKKVYERKGNFIFEYTYDENNTLKDTVKADADKHSSFAIEETDFLNIGDQQTREVINLQPTPAPPPTPLK